MTSSRHPRRGLVPMALPLLLLLACAVAAMEDVTQDRPAHRCIHDEIVAKQLEGDTLEAALSSGRFLAPTVVHVPRARDLAAADSVVEYSPIRIVIYTEDVYDSSKYCTVAGQQRPDFEGSLNNCTEDDILTAAKQDLLVNTMIPAAIAMHSARLSVKPLSRITVGTSVGTSLSGSICGSFTAPDDVKTYGVADADFVLFVAAGPITGNTVAWATTCGFGTGNRPVVGVVNVKPKYIDGTDQSIRTVTHEIMHALGFSGSLFQELGLSGTMSSLRSVPDVPVIDSPNVLQRAGNQFNCSVVAGMELDNSGGDGTAGSHWSVRNARQDMMCGYVGPSMKYSAITMAAMEDLGFYKPNYDNAEYMDWGFQAGCDLLEKKCVEDGVSQFPTMFCDDLRTTDGPLFCNADRTALGYCAIFRYNGNLPSYFQYFSNAALGGDDTSDYCPMISAYSNTGCAGGSQAAMPNSLIGNTSRCVDTAPNSALTNAICVDVKCDMDAQTYTVMFLGGSGYVDCPEGETIDAAASSSAFRSRSYITCPSFGVFCPKAFNSLSVNVTRGGPTSVDGASPRYKLCLAIAILAAVATFMVAV